MATTKKPADAAPQELAAPDSVQLRCEELGLTQDFTPKHAADILNWQQERGLQGKKAWQPVEAAASTEA